MSALCHKRTHAVQQRAGDDEWEDRVADEDDWESGSACGEHKIQDADAGNISARLLAHQ
jgi:hypothetical protein